MINGEFKSASGHGGYGSILTGVGNGQKGVVNMLQFDFDKDGVQEMYLAAMCAPGAVAWPPILLKVNPDLTIDPGQGKPPRGVELPAGIKVGRGGFEEFRADGDTLRLSFPVSAPGDPACCPSLTEAGNYVVQNGRLVRAAESGAAAKASGQEQPVGKQRCEAPHLAPKSGTSVAYCDGTWAKVGKPHTDMVQYFYWKDDKWLSPEPQGTNQYGMSMPCYSADYLSKLPPRPSEIKLYECKPQDIGKF